MHGRPRPALEFAKHFFPRASLRGVRLGRPLAPSHPRPVVVSLTYRVVFSNAHVVCALVKDMRPIDDSLWKDLLALASDPRNTVVVVSGRERALVSQWLGDLPVWIAAENGIYYRLGGRSSEWQSDHVESVDDDWISSITPVFRYFEERTPGSVTEMQEHSITWHYREADEDFGEIQASVLQARALSIWA